MTNLTITQHVMGYWGGYEEDVDHSEALAVGNVITDLFRSRIQDLVPEEMDFIQYPPPSFVQIDPSLFKRRRMFGGDTLINYFNMWEITPEEFTEIVKSGAMAPSDKGEVWKKLKKQDGDGACLGINIAFALFVKESGCHPIPILANFTSFLWERKKWSFFQLVYNKSTSFTSIRGSPILIHPVVEEPKDCLNDLGEIFMGSHLFLPIKSPHEDSSHSLYLFPSSTFCLLFDANLVIKPNLAYCLQCKKDIALLNETLSLHIKSEYPDSEFYSLIRIMPTRGNTSKMKGISSRGIGILQEYFRLCKNGGSLEHFFEIFDRLPEDLQKSVFQVMYDIEGSPLFKNALQYGKERFYNSDDFQVPALRQGFNLWKNPPRDRCIVQ